MELLLNAMQHFQRNLLLQRSAAMAVGQLSTELKTKERNLENKALQLLMQAQRGGIEELQELAQRGLQEALPQGELQRRAAATEAIGACHLASHTEKLRIFANL